jgi:hypothetical protein
VVLRRRLGLSVPHPGVLICIIVLIVVGPIGSILAALRFWPDFATPADHWALLGAVFAGGAVWEGALAGRGGHAARESRPITAGGCPRRRRRTRCRGLRQGS